MSAHTSMPQEGVNAVEKMAKIITSIDKIKFTYMRHRLLSAPLISPGTTIQGGTAINVIPGSCVATFDIRTVPGQTREQTLEEIKEFIRNLSKEDSDLKAEVESIQWIDPGEISEEERIVKIASQVTKNITGSEPKMLGNPAASDAHLLINQGGIPTIPWFGPGTLRQLHKPDEYIEISNLITATKIFAEIICDYLQPL